MSEEKKAFLMSNGVDLDSAINYVGDLEFYNEIMLEFYNGIDEQVNTLANAKNDMPNYAILVHALKSNARTLGVNYLFDVCYQHEMESKANNSQFVNEHFNDILVQVNRFKEMVQKYKEIN